MTYTLAKHGVLLFAAAAALTALGQNPSQNRRPAPLPHQRSQGGPPSAEDRYQRCFQKMVDAKATDNSFMRKCLGLNAKGAKEESGADSKKGFAPAIAAVLKGGQPELEACYKKLLKKAKKLGVTPKGSVRIAWGYQKHSKKNAPEKEAQPKNGSAKPSSQKTDPTVQLEPEGLVDTGFLGCVKERAAAWDLPSPPKGRTPKAFAEFTFSASSSTGIEVALTEKSPTITGVPALTPKEKFRVFQSHVGTVRACYNKLVRTRPTASGALQAELIVSANGRVKNVRFIKLSLKHPKFRRCVSQALKSWRFPDPATGTSTKVRYPPVYFRPFQARP